MNINYYEKIADMRTSDKEITFTFDSFCIATVKKVERIKEDFVNFKVKPKDNWYVSFYFDELCFSKRYEMPHSTDYDSKYKSFRRVADKAMNEFNVDLNKLVDKKFNVLITTKYRLDKLSNKYTMSQRITDMRLIEEFTNGEERTNTNVENN